MCYYHWLYKPFRDFLSKRNMSVKKYKLVPISFFDSMGEKEIRNIEEMETRDDGVNEDARSIKDIESANLHNTNFEPSDHYVADFKIGKSNEKDVKSGGVVSKNKLEGTVSDMREVDNMKFIDELLSNTSIPEELKIKLYMLLRQKYDHNKENIENKIENDDDSAPSHRGVLGKVIADLHSTKAQAGYNLANILLNEPKHIRWNSDGAITHPYLKDNKAFNLKMLIKSVLYKRTPQSHTDIALRIIRPFYEKLEKAGVLLNDKLILKSPQVISNYVAW